MPATVLIVDDCLEDREVYRRYLHTDERYAYQILEEECAEDALELCASVVPDVILLDYLLPDLDGLEFIQALKTRYNGNLCPVVMLTGQGNEEVAVQAMKNGVQDYLIKSKTTAQGLCRALDNVLEKTKLKRQLRQSEVRFRTSVENLLDCFGIYTSIRDGSGRIADFRVEYVNAAACRNNLMSKEEQIGKRLSEILPAHWDGLFEEYCQVVETGVPLVKEAKIYANSYTQQYLTRALDIRATKLGDGFVVAWRDVTRTKQAEERLQLLETVAVRANDAVIITAANSVDEPEPRILYINEAFTRMTGYTAEEVVGRSPRFLQGPNTDPAILAQIRVALEAKEPIRAELINYRKDGSEFWAEVGITPVVNEQKECTTFVAIVRNVTERKQTEAQLQDSQRFVQKVAETLPNILYIYDLVERRNVYVNRQLVEVLGYRPSQVQAMGASLLPTLVHPDDFACLPEHYQKADRAADGEVLELQYRIRHANGEWRWLVSRETIFARTPDGFPRQLLGIAQDITDRKYAEAERDRLFQLEQAARSEAEAATRAKDDFVSMVSHDLRTPLNAIQGWAQLLRMRKNEPEVVDKALAIIERNVRTQEKLLEDLLDVSRIAQGKLKIALRPLSLVPVVREAINAAYPTAQEKGIHLESQLDQNLEPVSGDPDRLKQVLGNLLSNALKFTPQGGSIVVQLQQLDSMAQLSVRDTGEGIKPELLPQIFDRFQQGEGTNQSKGLGLGLAIARHLVELHGGKIEVNSTLGEGTTFIIQLPLAAHSV